MSDSTPDSTPDDWQVYVHREDETVMYEARQFGNGRVEVRELPERGGTERGTLHAAFFEDVYRPYRPEEDEGG